MVGGFWAQEHPDEMSDLETEFIVKEFDWQDSASAIESVNGLHIDVFIGRVEWMNIFVPLARALAAKGSHIRHFIGIQSDDTALPPTALRELGICAAIAPGVPISGKGGVLREVLDQCPVHVDFMDFVDELEQMASYFNSTEITILDRQILQLLALGFTDNEIADVLHYSNQTIRNHISATLRTTGSRNRTELALRWRRFGHFNTPKDR